MGYTTRDDTTGTAQGRAQGAAQGNGQAWGRRRQARADVDGPTSRYTGGYMDGSNGHGGTGGGLGGGMGGGHYSGEDVERPLPQNVDAEASLLGSILIDGDVLRALDGWITAEMFYREAHRYIYAAMQETLRMERVYRPNGGAPADIIQTQDALQRAGRLVDVGGMAYVTSLANQVPTSANAERYARAVEHAYRQRAALDVAARIAGVAQSGADPDTIRKVALEAIHAALPLPSSARVRWLRDVLSELMDETTARMTGQAAVDILPSGFTGINEYTGGYEPGDLVVIAGRAGTGKSAVGRREITHVLTTMRDRAIADPTLPVGTALYVTLEMSSRQQARNIVATAANLNTQQIRSGFRGKDGEIDYEAHEAFAEWVGMIDRDCGGQLAMVDESVTVDELEQVVAQQVAEHHLRIVLVDQLDLFADDSPRRRSEYDLVTDAIKRLKQIARSYGIVVLCLAQINRDGADVRPRLQMLRNSGRVEQDPDVVILLYRPAHFTPDACADEYYENYMEAILAKVRGGPANKTALLFWSGSRQDITDWPNGLPVPNVDGGDDDDVPETPAKKAKKAKQARQTNQARQAQEE